MLGVPTKPNIRRLPRQINLREPGVLREERRSRLEILPRNPTARKGGEVRRRAATMRDDGRNDGWTNRAPDGWEKKRLVGLLGIGGSVIHEVVKDLRVKVEEVE